MPSARKTEHALRPFEVTRRIHEDIQKNPDRYPKPESAEPRVGNVKGLIHELDNLKEEFEREKEIIRDFIGPEAAEEREMEEFIRVLPPKAKEELYTLAEVARTVRHMEEEGITPKKLEELEEIYEALPPGFLEQLEKGVIPMNEVLMRIVEQHEHKSVLSRIAGFFKHLFAL